MLQLYTTHHSNSYVFIYHRAFSNPDAELVAAGIDALHVAILDNLASRIPVSELRRNHCEQTNNLLSSMRKDHMMGSH